MKAFYETRQYNTPLKIWNQTYQDIRFIAHWHTEIELILVRKGSAEITIDDKEILAYKGDLVICDSGKIHHSSPAHMDNLLEFLIFDPSIIHPLFDGFHLETPLITKQQLSEMKLDNEVENLFQMINHELKQQEDFYDEVASTTLKRCCYLLQRKTQHLTKNKKDSEYKEKIYPFQQLLDYIESHYNEDISLEEASNKMNLSKSYFSSLFKDYIGSNFTKYLNSIRIENAMVDLKNESLNITNIALNHGFNNIRTFNRVFKEFTGVTPSNFRNQTKTNSTNYSYQIRKNSRVEHTEQFTNKTLVHKD